MRYRRDSQLDRLMASLSEKDRARLEALLKDLGPKEPDRGPATVIPFEEPRKRGKRT